MRNLTSERGTLAQEPGATVRATPPADTGALREEGWAHHVLPALRATLVTLVLTGLLSRSS